MGKETLAFRIYDTLKRVPCVGHVDKKGRFSYLKWQKAYEFLNENFPNNSFEFKTFQSSDGLTLDYMQYPDGTGSVHCEITIRDGEETVSKSMYLPILNHSNNPMKNPNSMAINTAKQRCFVKCLAMMGLGMHIYLGAEDDPVYDDTEVTVDDTNKAAPAPINGGEGAAPSPQQEDSSNGLNDLRNLIRREGLDGDMIDSFFMKHKGDGLFAYVSKEPGARLRPAIEFLESKLKDFRSEEN